MAVQFDTAHYVRSHARAPRGTGCWCFEVEGQQMDAWGTYTDAKAQVREWARTRCTGTVVVTVMP